MSNEEEPKQTIEVSTRVANSIARNQTRLDSIDVLTAILCTTIEESPYPTAEPVKNSVWTDYEKQAIKDKIFELVNLLI